VLLEKNLRLGNCEIDIIALDRQFDEIVFIEVKYLITDDFGDASQAVDQKKLKNMIKVANNYLRKKQFKKSHRFDIISVAGNLTKPRVEHFENVTWL
jgi:Holliday junction resolvase-like predicted endonuclease